MKLKNNSVMKLKTNSVKKRRRFDKDNLQLLILNLPSLIWVFIFCYLPMVGLIIAFKKIQNKLGDIRKRMVWVRQF